MMDDERLAQTEALFRDVNERIAEKADNFDTDDDALFVCECSDVDCNTRVHTDLETYEEVREDGATFIVADGHENEGIERVVRRRHGVYAIVEKVKPRMRAIVKRLDPRAETA